MPEPLLYPLAKAAARLGISKYTLADHVKAGRISCRQAAPLKGVYFTEDDLRAFIESCLVPARQDARS